MLRGLCEQPPPTGSWVVLREKEISGLPFIFMYGHLHGCLFICVGKYVCVSVHAHVCLCLWKSEVSPRCHLSLGTISFALFESEFLTGTLGLLFRLGGLAREPVSTSTVQG